MTKKNISLYKIYNPKCIPPPKYYRYQSNICDPTQNSLPLTMPNPNENTVKPQMDKIMENIFFQNSFSCTNSSGNESPNY